MHIPCGKSIYMVVFVWLGPAHNSRFFIGITHCKSSKCRKKRLAFFFKENNLFKEIICALLLAFEKSLIIISTLLPKWKQKKTPWSLPLLSETQLSCYTNLCARLLAPEGVFQHFHLFIINSQSKTYKN